MENQFKPTCKIVGEDGNIFSILGRVIRALNDPEKANEVSVRVMDASTYDKALQIIMEYVEVE